MPRTGGAPRGSEPSGCRIGSRPVPAIVDAWPSTSGILDMPRCRKAHYYTLLCGSAPYATVPTSRIGRSEIRVLTPTRPARKLRASKRRQDPKGGRGRYDSARSERPVALDGPSAIQDAGPPVLHDSADGRRAPQSIANDATSQAAKQHCAFRGSYYRYTQNADAAPAKVNAGGNAVLSRPSSCAYVDGAVLQYCIWA